MKNNIHFLWEIKFPLTFGGRFKRPPCEVGAQGPHKFEFCGVDKGCVKGSQVGERGRRINLGNHVTSLFLKKNQKHTEANCSVSFPYKGKEVWMLF